MNLVVKKICSIVALAMIAIGLSISLFHTENVNAAQDCDSNAVIYCGVTSKTDLKNKINNGTGKKYQSGSELTWLFNRYNIYANDASSLKDGYVTNDNKVVTGGKTVATNVYTMGRSYMPGSADIPNIYYPLYLRHPSVSFRSSTIPAYVKMNPDGTMAYAIITSCGNIVPGVKYVEPTYKLTTWKYEDTDRDGKRDTNEPLLADWVFDITGPNGYKNTLTTSSNGGITITKLKKGTYTVTERQKSGWQSTTGLTQKVTLSDSSKSIYFGNARIVEARETVNIRVAKYNDANGNSNKDDNEEMLSGWRFRVTGPNGYSTDLITEDNGIAELTGLEPGEYTVTEVLAEGWENTTGLTVSHEVTTNESTQDFIFGNKVVSEQEITGGGETLPSSGPLQTAAIAGGAIAFSGAALAWLNSKKHFFRSFRK